MERRTQPGYEYHSCDFMDDGVYIDMNLLREYEDTGLTPEQIAELKERDTAKAPEVFDGHWYKCPTCGMYAGGLKGNFCHRCGQNFCGGIFEDQGTEGGLTCRN